MPLVLTPNVAGRYVCKITLYTVIVMEFLWMFIEARGDFANGILFYLQAQINIYVFGFFAVLFLSSYLLGRAMGANLIKGKSYFAIGAIYGLTEGLILMSYVMVTLIINGQWSNMLHSVPKLGLIVILLTTLLWLVVARSLKNNAP